MASPADEVKVDITEIYQEYRRPILIHLVRLVSNHEAAEDLCQETFIKAIRHWDQHDPAASVSAWLYRIATNTAYDYLRRRRRVQFMSLVDDGVALQPVAGTTFEAALEDAEPVHAALRQLPPRYRVPLMLQTYEGRSMHEIADTLGVSSSAVKTRLFRARERFRQVYQG